MRSLKIVLLPLLLVGSSIHCMNYEMVRYKKQAEKVSQIIEQIKKALFEKTSSVKIQEMLEELKKNMVNVAHMSSSSLYKEILEPQKAILIGNAESAARVVDLKLQHLIRANKDVSPELQEHHANARTNIHLIKDFLYSIEKLCIPRGFGYK